MPENNDMTNRQNSGNMSDKEKFDNLLLLVTKNEEKFGSLTTQLGKLSEGIDKFISSENKSPNQQKSLDQKSFTDDLIKGIQKAFRNELRRAGVSSSIGQSQSTQSSRYRDIDFHDISDRFNDAAKSLDDFKKYIKITSEQTRRTIDDLKQQQRNLTGVVRNVESFSMDRQVSILEQYQKRLEDIEKEIKQGETDREGFAQSVTDVTSKIEDTKRRLQEEDRKRIAALRAWHVENSKAASEQDADLLKAAREEADKYSDSVRKIKDELADQRQRLSSLNEQIKESEKAQKESTEQKRKEAEQERKSGLEDLQNNLEPILRLVNESTDAFRNAAGQSSILADWIQDNEQNEAQRFNATIAKTSDSLSRAIDELTKKIEEDRKRLNEDTSLTAEQRKNIEEEAKNLEADRETIKAQREAIQGVTPVTDQFHKISNNIKDVPWKSFRGMITNLTKVVESKYLDSYMEGFDKIYQSVENTRNQISARLRMDAGEFKDLQDDVYNQIVESGLEGSISLADVNDSIQALVSAGITDTDTMKALALESAKLRASGSSLNLTNEEMLTRTMSQINDAMRSGMSRDEAIQSAISQFETVANTEAALRKKYGQDMAFANGALEQIINTTSNMGTAFGKTQAEISKDMQDAMATAASLQQSGIDPNMLMSQLQKIVDGSITSQDAIGRAFINLGITPESLQTGELDLSDALDKIADTIASAYGDSSANVTGAISQIWGIDASNLDIERFKSAYSAGEIETTLSEESLSELEALRESNENALSEGAYLSATRKWEVKQENRATDEAITMEQIYKGNEVFHATVGGILDGVKEIVDILEQGAFTVGDMFRTSGMAIFGGSTQNTTPPTTGTGATPPTVPPTSGTGAGFATTARSFMTGDLSTTAGKIGTGLGVGVGAGMSIYSIAKNASEYDGAEAVEKTFTDPTFYSGVGTALGSAIAGPIGGAIGGVAGKLASEVGNALGDFIAHMDDEDSLEESANSLKMSADALTASANEQYKKAKAEYDKLSKYSNEEKKLALIQNGNLTLDEANQKGEEELQKLFEDNLLKQKENLLAEAAEKIKTSTYVSENSQNIANMTEIFAGMDDWLEQEEQYYGDTKEGKEEFKKYKQSQLSEDVSKFEGAIGGPQAMKELYSLFEVGEKVSDDELRLNLVNQGASEKDIENASREVLESKYKELSVENFKKTANMSDYTSTLLDESIRRYEERQSGYEKANKDFQTRWSTIVEKYPDAELATLRLKYADEYDVIPNVKFDETGTAYLDPESINYKETYVGKFKSGLTDVPFDEYPALLHEGERVLTKEEAQAYNELSSNAVEQLAHINDVEYDEQQTSSAYFDKILEKIKDFSDAITVKYDTLFSEYDIVSTKFDESSKQYETLSNIDERLITLETSYSDVGEDITSTILDAIKQIGVDDRELNSASIDTSSIDTPSINIPDINIPDINVPDINVPDIDIPDINVSNIVDIPEMQIPEMQIPEIELPEIEISNNIPQNIEFPKLELPEIDRDFPELPDISQSNEYINYITESSNTPEIVHSEDYNEISSYIKEQMSSVSDTIKFSSMIGEEKKPAQIDAKTLGTDTINNSITNQTTTLEKKLDAILNALTSFIVTVGSVRAKTVADNTNILRGNSNVTQINTIR